MTPCSLGWCIALPRGQERQWLCVYDWPALLWCLPLFISSSSICGLASCESRSFSDLYGPQDFRLSMNGCLVRDEAMTQHQQSPNDSKEKESMTGESVSQSFVYFIERNNNGYSVQQMPVEQHGRFRFRPHASVVSWKSQCIFNVCLFVSFSVQKSLNLQGILTCIEIEAIVYQLWLKLRSVYFINVV